MNILRPNLFTIRRLFLSLQRKVKLPSTCVMVILELYIQELVEVLSDFDRLFCF